MAASESEPSEARELGEELHLADAADFFVADQPLAHLHYIAWSESARQEARYTIELFPVQLTGDAQQTVAADPQNRWLTEAEIQAKQRHSGGGPESWSCESFASR